MKKLLSGLIGFGLLLSVAACTPEDAGDINNSVDDPMVNTTDLGDGLEEGGELETTLSPELPE